MNKFGFEFALMMCSLHRIYSSRVWVCLHAKYAVRTEFSMRKDTIVFEKRTIHVTYATCNAANRIIVNLPINLVSFVSVCLCSVSINLVFSLVFICKSLFEDKYVNLHWIRQSTASLHLEKLYQSSGSTNDEPMFSLYLSLVSVRCNKPINTQL